MSKPVPSDLSVVGRPVEQSGGRWSPQRYRSAAFTRTVDQLRRFARYERATVLLEGETGTGKTQLARYLHTLSPRASKPFHQLVLSSLDDTLAGSELFGHVVGAFTDARANRVGAFASSHGGTLFLDEIGKASPSLQQRLLHAIEYGEIRPIGSDCHVHVDVRIVAASNTPLKTLVDRGHFLPDLHARLMSLRVCVPALRERRADIPELARECLEVLVDQDGASSVPELDPLLMDALQKAPWPYNLRELNGTLHRLLIEADGEDPITLLHCPPDLDWLKRLAERPRTITADVVGDALKRAGTVSGAARLLGVHRTTIQRFRRRSASDSSETDVGS